MERKIITTADGSKTIYLPELDEHYHSKHGAIQEAYHVFIKMGLDFLIQKKLLNLNILEIGFGTGLNAFITFLQAKKQGLQINYTGVEAFPIPSSEVVGLNYVELLSASESSEVFDKIHQVSWEQNHEIEAFFTLKKRQMRFEDINDFELYNLIYFDAFGARVQPELWTVEIFKKMHKALKPEGVLVTYSAKGSVRRALQQVGFLVERLPGPPGKREMLRGVKV
ncbi:MAG TPA: tRNA (5-methylaminomethyl-2-thiouridine)(34)-methyltransferase MnmD [Salinimicrobium sp.]|nr:tRNA (5-methylaminomethyl-2-thiouridine)(34)-methyltransferase MnmD [Salinimicrobium sp.]